ncbi:MAG TPA: hypothetical protein VFW17_13235 [Ktedonobacterales bacterium]|jgi:hypothetical protein|nr:hypothetical protein [Ktedonobacterales bacterium]
MTTEDDDLDKFIAECAEKIPIFPQWLRLHRSAAKLRTDNVEGYLT